MSEAAGLTTKERRRASRTLGGMAAALEKSGDLRSAADMELAIEALGLGAAVHTYPQRFQIARSRLMAARREELGLPEPVIAVETARTFDIEIGGLLVQDAARDLHSALASNPLHRYLNDSGDYFVAFGGDGTIKVRLRIHTSGPAEPQSTEFRKLREATPAATLLIDSGAVALRGGGKVSIDQPLDTGRWTVAAFGLGMGRKPECLLIVAPQDAAPPPLVDTPELMI